MDRAIAKTHTLVFQLKIFDPSKGGMGIRLNKARKNDILAVKVNISKGK